MPQRIGISSRTFSTADTRHSVDTVSREAVVCQVFVGRCARLRHLLLLERYLVSPNKFADPAQSEPPNLATEINARWRANRAPSPPSPLRIRQTPIARTRGTEGISRPELGSLGKPLLVQTPWRWRESGANSSQRSLPYPTGKTPGNSSNRLFWADPGPRFQSVFSVVVTDSL